MTTYQATPVAEIPTIRARLYEAFATGKTKDVAFRKTQLLQLAYMFQDNKQQLHDALVADLGHHPNETEYIEYSAIANHALKAYENVDAWAKPESPAFSLNTFPMSPRTYKQPKGVVLIIGPYNYPMFCVVIPLIGAIAAGCAVVVKPSEMTPHAAAFLTDLLPKYLDPTLYTVVNGAVPETTELLNLSWDHIFFTGGARVGRIVASAAAKHLTPVTLELGGKSPAIVDNNCDFDATARRILWGKMLNAGQSCTAPDYVMVVREGHDKLVAAFKKAHAQFFPSAETETEQTTRLINAAAFQRLTGLLDRTSGTVILGGERDSSRNWLATTIVDNCPFDDSLMTEELFGPVLPIVTVETIEDAVARISKGDRPLGCFVFSKNKKTIDYVFKNTTSGSVVANDSVIQAGGERTSLSSLSRVDTDGSSSGKYAFDTFTQLRGSLQFPLWLEGIMAHRYPPYTVS
ncbi:NAD-dependent aldehyde dehydrogenase [Exidia glandulosa HHB12029]|uniref:Aldehyde dehydrogenase n=1 Tax=Exidia glandulosa HHB12029 TaxID=1314781 RepID=A0A165GLD3_EXIGL|nr:NAD-dependent aldehyde dehydrogenase [Exidia glandulosa HHB12029]